MNNPIKILIVDDVPANLIAIEAVLHEVEATLLLVESGEKALEVLMSENECPALIILDVHMPAMDGFELASIIRQRYKHVPIIFLSAVATDINHVHKGYETGAVDFITKPFNSMVLCAKVRVFLELHRYRLQSLQLQEIEKLAFYDPLTKLPNRRLFVDRLNQSMARIDRNAGMLAVLLIDLDGFKLINDVYGHEIGDQFLILISQKIKCSVRETDTVARLGGDEFIVLLEGIEGQECAQYPIHNILKSCSESITINNLTLKLSASIGASSFVKNLDIDASQIIRQADQSMYIAKKSGKNQFHWFDERYDNLANGENEMIAQIISGIDRNEFLMYYQPIVNMKSGELLAVEALIRWQHPIKGLLQPAAFLPFINMHPVNIELGKWVIRKVLEQLYRWQLSVLSIKAHINVDAIHISQSDFLDNLKHSLSLYPQLEKGKVEIEILETTAISNLKYTNKIINQCQSLGISVAIDDFGTGYSSLTYLKNLSFNTIKIDRSFVSDMTNNTRDLAIVESVIILARAFNKDIVAEGVRTIEQGKLLLQLGCEVGQGFLIAKPMPAENIEKWSLEWSPFDEWLGAPCMA